MLAIMMFMEIFFIRYYERKLERFSRDLAPVLIPVFIHEVDGRCIGRKTSIGLLGMCR